MLPEEGTRELFLDTDCDPSLWLPAVGALPVMFCREKTGKSSEEEVVDEESSSSKICVNLP